MVNRSKNKMTNAAKRAATQYGLTALGKDAVVKLMREFRSKRRERGNTDRCKDVALMLNEAGVMRSWYTTGEHTFDAWSVRATWAKQHGSWDAGYKRLKKPKMGTDVPRLGTDRAGSLACTLGEVSKEAEQFCSKNEIWHPIAGYQLLRAVRLALRLGKSGDKIVDDLNDNHRLRHNYKRGLPRWTLQELSRTVKLINDGQGLKQIKDHIMTTPRRTSSVDVATAAEDLLAPVKEPYCTPVAKMMVKRGQDATHEIAEENQQAERMLASARGKSPSSIESSKTILQKIHQDGTCTIGVTRLVKRFTTETVPITDPRVVKILRDRLNNNNK